MRQIKTLLIANRGEIALRVMHTAKAMGIRTVAVYSDADATAPHVAFADAAVRLGPAPVAESYLNMAAVLDAAKRSGADAIHPGYGFLSENSAFADAVAEAGMVFVGPSAHAIEAMGDKARAKRAMIEAKVPCIPGYEGEDQDSAQFITAADEIGFPVMVKAAAGGGGRGMRLVHDAKNLPEALQLARSEAENAFGSGDLILEKAIIEPRHVEIQVFADAHGNTIHLGERDCSVQRRHQKVLEESPCPVMTPELRAAMGEAAVAAAQAVDYRGAGTVEFLLDKDRNFYFLEMNTRLQVEHPVTELVTGLDLVALQIRAAQGEELGIAQDDVALKGHAIEARLYAEDPALDFQPATGKIALWQAPEGEGIRCDDGITTGGEVSPFYDAMVAKIMAWGETRKVALSRLAQALDKTTLFGVRTNQAFLASAIEKSGFANGEATTAFIAEEFGEEGFADPEPTLEDMAVAAALLHRKERAGALGSALHVPEELLEWSSSLPRPSTAVFDDQTFQTSASGGDRYAVRSGEGETEIIVRDLGPSHAKLHVNGVPQDYTWAVTGQGEIYLRRSSATFDFQDTSAVLSANDAAAGGGNLVANMHGSLIEVFVKPGDKVKAGDRLAVLEAMKMQHQLEAEIDGTVEEVLAEAGAQLASGDLILTITEDEDAGS
ncbi:acetyl-CoA carboxylase biotin carboxylase subunit [Alterisphingorhabdus coralli]|uniref:Acetyl-CoA carboxylase biotin carboxylase subunit n=1 Tax=Alterisphingorhabdus coralli TaxID=3071408 RepID=A0AA97F3Z2_9SPHN|nr:acetyl-CoA carboxylase biotin carboxylase subunit [Parasphingorhabdus sp. SCSIO 66989]WOE73869.1 acetyl-CoA carboxylase biotin carboxylase subunit [Parasphingorhabdus sp. SCSIO 66989]